MEDGKQNFILDRQRSNGRTYWVFVIPTFARSGTILEIFIFGSLSTRIPSLNIRKHWEFRIQECLGFHWDASDTCQYNGDETQWKNWVQVMITEVKVQ